MKSAVTLVHRRLLAWVVGALLALFAADASALCTVTCTCTVSTTNVAFGTINPLSLFSTDSVGGVSVTCGGIAGLLIPLQVDISTGSSGSYASRKMVYGSYKLTYNLYKDSGYTQVFGDTTNGTVDASGSVTLAALGTAPPVNFPIYGRVFGAQTTLAPGAYVDTIAVTLTYY